MSIKSPASSALMLSIAYLKVCDLIPYSNNARKHPQKQLQKLAANIKNMGFLVPILIDQNHNIIAGHARVEAAKIAGLEEIPAIMIDHLTEAEQKAFRLADNRLSQDASWDKQKLKLELELLNDIGFELDLTGFETVETDLVLGGEEPSIAPEDEAEVLPPDYRPVTQISDVWELGNHRLICGDSLKQETYQSLLGPEKAQIVFTDPPYNVAIDGHVKRKAETGAREFLMASGEMSSSEFTNFLRQFLMATAAVISDGAIAYVCMDWRHTEELLAASKQVMDFKQLCVWAKDKAGMGTFYRSQHELIFAFKNGTAPHINNFGLGGKGRYRTNIWNYPVVHPCHQENLDGICHPTVKPVSMVIDALRDCSHRKDIVLDPFGGSGTTLIAAEKVGRRARLIELDPIYCDMIVRRWEKFTGKEARLRGSGESFKEVREKRITVVEGQFA